MSFDLTMSLDKELLIPDKKRELMKYIYASLDGSVYDIATVVHHLYENLYKVAKIKSKLWYVFDGLKWKPSELGPYYQLSTTVAKLYNDVLFDERDKKETFESQLNNINEFDENDHEKQKEIQFIKNSLKTTEKVIYSLEKIVDKLKNVNTKETICKECLYLFYDPDFLYKLDMNSNLICFTNGVLDLQQKELRQGRYDDYISLSIKLNFINPKSISEQKELSHLLEEFQQFRNKITNKRQNKLVYVV